MDNLKYKFFPEGELKGQYIPIGIALVDYMDVLTLGMTPQEACERIAKRHSGPIAINIWDTETACTTTSNGIMYDGSIVAMAAADYGKINKEFGYLDMKVIEFDSEEGKLLRKEEPHLIQWEKIYPNRRMIQSPVKKKVPVHMVAITGRAGNNNSATEVMHYVNMEELLFPVSGQMAVLKKRNVCYGRTGGVISVGIGMQCGEKYGRIVPNRTFPTGTTAHGSGEYAKTLKAHIPIIAAEKSMLAEYIIQALEVGLIPGRHIGGSPAVLNVAKKLGVDLGNEYMSDAAKEELASVGIDDTWFDEPCERMTKQEIIDNADDIIPGIDELKVFKPEELYTLMEA